jgi:hypothetical protein
MQFFHGLQFSYEITKEKGISSTAYENRGPGTITVLLAGTSKGLKNIANRIPVPCSRVPSGSTESRETAKTLLYQQNLPYPCKTNKNNSYEA